MYKFKLIKINEIIINFRSSRGRSFLGVLDDEIKREIVTVD